MENKNWLTAHKNLKRDGQEMWAITYEFKCNLVQLVYARKCVVMKMARDIHS